MNTNILESIFGSFDISIIFFALSALLIALIVVLLLCTSRINSLKLRLDAFMIGQNAASLEETVDKLIADYTNLTAATQRNTIDIKKIYANLQIAFQYCGIVKYDAYDQMGGHLSFSLVMLDKDLNGICLNCVHNTQSCYTYIKEIELGKCKTEMAEEEKQALAIAVSQKQSGTR